MYLLRIKCPSLHCLLLRPSCWGRNWQKGFYVPTQEAWNNLERHQILLDFLSVCLYCHLCCYVVNAIWVCSTATNRSLCILKTLSEKQTFKGINSVFNGCQAKILDHDNVNYLKKILAELAMVLDQVEAELEKRKLEYQGTSHWLSSIKAAAK